MLMLFYVFIKVFFKCYLYHSIQTGSVSFYYIPTLKSKLRDNKNIHMKAQFTKLTYYATPFFEMHTTQDFPNGRYVLFITEIFLSLESPQCSKYSLVFGT